MSTPAHQPPKSAAQHLGFLDGIRGFASLWVVLSHGLKMTGWSVPLLKRGDVAVDVFMIMSGFLMAHHYLLRRAQEPWESAQTWRTFLARRFFRIAPLYYLALGISMATGPWFWEWRDGIAQHFPTATTPSARYLDRSLENVITHLTFVFGMIPSKAFSTSLPDWSIGLEMQFYIAFPLIMLVLDRFKAFWGAVLLCAFGLGVQRIVPSNLFPMPAFLPLKLSLFVVGILLAVANHLRMRNTSEAGFTATLALLVAASTQSSLVIIMTALVAALLWYDRPSDPFHIRKPLATVETLLSGRFASFMADTSYAVYLIHMMIMLPIAGFLADMPAYRSLPGIARFAAVVVPVVLLVYPAAWMIFKWVEKPGIALGKKLMKPRHHSV